MIIKQYTIPFYALFMYFTGCVVSHCWATSLSWLSCKMSVKMCVCVYMLVFLVFNFLYLKYLLYLWQGVYFLRHLFVNEQDYVKTT